MNDIERSPDVCDYPWCSEPVFYRKHGVCIEHAPHDPADEYQSTMEDAA